MKQITFNRIAAWNFKSHRRLEIELGPVTRISGENGEGKSSIGETITWALFGCDTLGNQMTKNLSPEPTNYEYDVVHVQLLLTIDDKQVLVGRMIEKGSTKFYINETPKKATEFNDIIESIFEKNLFLSLFNPAYFFSQKSEDQRAQLVKSVLPPANSEVLSRLPKPQADKLGPLLKLKQLVDLEAQHKDKKNRQDKALIAAKERVKTLREQLKGATDATDDEKQAFVDTLKVIDEKIAATEAKQREAMQVRSKIDRLTAERSGIKGQIESMKSQHAKLSDTPVPDHCDKCGQALNEQSVETTKGYQAKELKAIVTKHNELVAKHKELSAELKNLIAIEFEPEDLRLMYESRQEINGQLQASTARGDLLQQIAAAELNEQETHDSFTESVFILDAIKAFKAKEAELMAGKIGELFTTLTLQLFQINKTDGEQKPHFEVEMDGKPYRKLSVGEKIRAGLELIAVMSKQNEIVVPCMIDNAESYTGTISVLGQAIICRAVPDKKLEIKTEE